MAHRRLSIIDIENGNQPMLYTFNDKIYRITYNGEIYNMMEIKNHLVSLGYTFQTMSDTEVVLASYIEYQENCLDLFEGIFAFVIDDGDKLFVARDPLGVKPVSYTHLDVYKRQDYNSNHNQMDIMVSLTYLCTLLLPLNTSHYNNKAIA